MSDAIDLVLQADDEECGESVKTVIYDEHCTGGFSAMYSIYASLICAMIPVLAL